MTQKQKQQKQKRQAERRQDMPLREDGQVYAQVAKMLGNGRVLATCADGEERLCKIRGSMRKREWVHVGDTVLVALRDFQDTKADIVYKYQENEVHRLRKLGEDLVVQRSDSDDDAVCFEPLPDDELDMDAI